MLGWFEMILATVIALLPIANPFSTSALFLSITSGDTPERRDAQATRGCIYMAAILTAFLLAGTLIMEFFGISIPGLRIAGGFMVARVGLGMLKPGDERHTPEAQAEAREKPDISFTPLAMPSLSGPGAIAVTLGLASETEGLAETGAVMLGILVVALICWIVLRGAGRVVPYLGQNGINVMNRIMGFLLLCVGIQFMVTGVRALIVDPVFLGALAEAWEAARS